MKPEEVNNPYQYPWAKWAEWLYAEPESYGSFGWNEQPKHNWFGKGQGSKGEHQLKTDPGGLIYEPSAWALKTSERPHVGNMPLLFEFSCYSNWDPAARRWSKLLYNHPVSSVIENYISNLKESSNILDRGGRGFSKESISEETRSKRKSLRIRGII